LKIDLHLHTTYSDGRLSPEMLIKMAYDNYYSYISITDHDSLAGYIEAKRHVKSYDIHLIPGVEISTMYEDVEIHILAYFIDEDNEELNDLLKKVWDSRYGRAKQMVENLETLGISLEWKDVLIYAGENKYIGRPHIARALMEKGKVKTIKEAFDKFLNNDSPVFVPKYKVDTEYAINVIKKANGASVLAHPGRLPDDSLVFSCIDMGIDGLEVFYASHDANQTRLYEQIAIENNLIRTGGSDFHGNEFYYINYSAPDICIDDIKKFLRKRKT